MRRNYHRKLWGEIITGNSLIEIKYLRIHNISVHISVLIVSHNLIKMKYLRIHNINIYLNLYKNLFINKSVILDKKDI